jgi:hypothetical protein
MLKQTYVTSTLKMDVIRSSETSAHIRTIRRHIPEDGKLATAVRIFNPTQIISSENINRLVFYIGDSFP